MIPLGTERKRCTRCHKLVLVPRLVPCENRLFLNGIWVSAMDEDYQEHTIGVLCFECAFETEMGQELEPFEQYEVTLGFSGGKISDLDNWDAMITRKKEGVCSQP